MSKYICGSKIKQICLRMNIFVNKYLNIFEYSLHTAPEHPEVGVLALRAYFSETKTDAPFFLLCQRRPILGIRSSTRGLNDTRKWVPSQ